MILYKNSNNYLYTKNYSISIKICYNLLTINLIRLDLLYNNLRYKCIYLHFTNNRNTFRDFDFYFITF